MELQNLIRANKSHGERVLSAYKHQLGPFDLGYEMLTLHITEVLSFKYSDTS